jgi:NAD+ kinase
MLLVHERNPRAVELFEAVREHLDVDALPDNLHLVFGGDGWMLKCVHTHGAGPVYLGLNAGHLGFLLNEVSDPRRVAAAIMAGAWKDWTFPLLHIEMTHPDGRVSTCRAVNDAHAERLTGQTAHLRVRVDGFTVVDEMVCDGLLTATALGSTAYNFSAGGVPCHPMVRGIHITPICPHRPRMSPLMLPQDSVVEVEVLRHERRPVRCAADGISQGEVHQMTISSAPDEIRLAFLDGHHFTETMLRKVLMS